MAAPLLIVVAALVIGVGIVRSTPKPERRAPERRPALVEVTPVAMGTHRVTVEAAGTVIPAREVVVRPRVSGVVQQLSSNLEPGGLFAEGDELLRIDPTDYKLALAQSEGAVVQAQTNLELELAQRAVAEAELRLTEQPVREGDRGKILREPQMRASQAAVAVAEAQRDRARVDLRRTRISAPFDAVVLTRSAEVGAQVNETTPLATLVGTERWRIEVSVPVDELHWLQVPRTPDDNGSVVHVHDPAATDEASWREGRVIRLAADLEPQGRMAQLLVEVGDPLSLLPENADRRPLLLGSFVQVQIEGTEVHNTVALDRDLLRDGDRVWVMVGEPDGQLQIRDVRVVFRGASQVLVSQGLAEGERIVTSDLASPVEGMRLRVRDATP